MIRIDRMALADLGECGKIADAVVAQLGDVQPPIDIEAVAYGCGVTEIAALQTDGFEGALITTAEKAEAVILINSASGSGRRRFTIGHELGHLLNPWHLPPPGGFQCTKSDLAADGPARDGRPEWEVQANLFSSRVLMPKRLVLSDLKKISSIDLEALRALQSRYDTSLWAIARSALNLHGDPFALVQSQDLIVGQIFRTSNFPYLSLSRGQSVHRKSITATFRGSQGQISSFDEAESAFWTTRSQNSRMYEQVLLQASNYRLTLLTVEPNDEDEPDDEDEYVRRREDWSPSFGRR